MTKKEVDKLRRTWGPNEPVLPSVMVAINDIHRLLDHVEEQDKRIEELEDKLDYSIEEINEMQERLRRAEDLLWDTVPFLISALEQDARGNFDGLAAQIMDFLGEWDGDAL